MGGKGGGSVHLANEHPEYGCAGKRLCCFYSHNLGCHALSPPLFPTPTLPSDQPHFVWVFGQREGRRPRSLAKVCPLPSPDPSPSLRISALPEGPRQLKEHFQISEEDILTVPAARTPCHPLWVKTGIFKICISISPGNKPQPDITA